MKSAACRLMCLLSAGLALASCQPSEPPPPPRQPLALDYTLLGIWPQRYTAYEISLALKEAGIGSQLSGRGPCALNVEAGKLAAAHAIVRANPSWRSSGLIKGDLAPVHDWPMTDDR